MDAICSLIDPKVLAILSIFSKNSSSYFHLNKLAGQAKVPVSTTFRIVNRLVSLGIVDRITIDNFKIYRLAESKPAREVCRVIKR